MISTCKPHAGRKKQADPSGLLVRQPNSCSLRAHPCTPLHMSRRPPPTCTCTRMNTPAHTCTRAYYTQYRSILRAPQHCSSLLVERI